MKIDFPLPTDGKMHRYCFECQADGVVPKQSGKQKRYFCGACGAVNDRAFFFHKQKAWLAEDGELRHESCGVFVRNTNGKYLFFKRTEYPFQLTIPAGHVDTGESPKEAALRELQEETGLVGEPELLGTEDVNGDLCSGGADIHRWHAFLLSLKEDGAKVGILEEGEKALWLTLDEAQKRGTIFVVDHMIKKYRKKL